jgi:hypothetical protein
MHRHRHGRPCQSGMDESHGVARGDHYGVRPLGGYSGFTDLSWRHASSFPREMPDHVIRDGGDLDIGIGFAECGHGRRRYIAWCGRPLQDDTNEIGTFRVVNGVRPP